MSDLTEKFGTVLEQMASQQLQLIEALSSIQSTLDNLDVALDTLNNNGAVNTRYLLAAIGANSPCAPCPTPPIVVPPITPFEVPIDEDKCKRAQAFLATMRDMFGVWDTFSSFDLTSNFTVITDAIGQVIARMGAGDTVPLPSFPEAVQLGGTLASFTAFNLFEHTSLLEQFDPLHDGLVLAIYNEPTPEGAKAQYDAIVAAGVTSHFLSDLMIGSAYNALWSYFFDPASMPDLTPYDGSICAPPSECETAQVPVTAGTSTYVSGGNTYSRVYLPDLPWNAGIVGTTTFTPSETVFVYFGPLGTFVNGGVTRTIQSVIDEIGVGPSTMDSASPSTTLSVEFCGLVV